jgi:hypothetical protein
MDIRALAALLGVESMQPIVDVVNYSFPLAFPIWPAKPNYSFVPGFVAGGDIRNPQLER